jgi:hypothetical protein
VSVQRCTETVVDPRLESKGQEADTRAVALRMPQFAVSPTLALSHTHTHAVTHTQIHTVTHTIHTHTHTHTHIYTLSHTHFVYLACARLPGCCGLPPGGVEPALSGARTFVGVPLSRASACPLPVAAAAADLSPHVAGAGPPLVGRRNHRGLLLIGFDGSWDRDDLRRYLAKPIGMSMPEVEVGAPPKTYRAGPWGRVCAPAAGSPASRLDRRVPLQLHRHHTLDASLRFATLHIHQPDMAALAVRRLHHIKLSDFIVSACLDVDGRARWPPSCTLVQSGRAFTSFISRLHAGAWLPFPSPPPPPVAAVVSRGALPLAPRAGLPTVHHHGGG